MAVESVPPIRGSIETHNSHNRFKKNVLDGAHTVPRTYSKCLEEEEEELKDVKCSGTHSCSSRLWFFSLDSLDKYISIISRRKVEPSLSQYVTPTSHYHHLFLKRL
jgi:hypothetical protein